MQSALEQEFGRLLQRGRHWALSRDRAVLAGAMLCCVPFLPVTFVGVAITLVNLLLLTLRRLPAADLPLLLSGLVVAILYTIAWWLLFHGLFNEARVVIHGIWDWVTTSPAPTQHPPVQSA